MITSSSHKTDLTNNSWNYLRCEPFFPDFTHLTNKSYHSLCSTSLHFLILQCSTSMESQSESLLPMFSCTLTVSKFINAWLKLLFLSQPLNDHPPSRISPLMLWPPFHDTFWNNGGMNDSLCARCRQFVYSVVSSFYPIFPVPQQLSSSINLDVSHSHLLRLGQGDSDHEELEGPAPDILILPSRLKHFHRVCLAFLASMWFFIVVLIFPLGLHRWSIAQSS